MFSTRTTRLLTTALCSGSVAAAMLAGATPALADQDPGANPPNCSAADLEGVRAGVSAATSAYLFTHPDVNDFFTNSLKGLTREQAVAKVRDYMATHPQAKADLTGIRQPLVDLRDRCALPPAP